MQQGRDHWLADEMAAVDDSCPVEPRNAEDPLFVLYTSGSTGRPKGVLHTTGGYLVYAAMTHELVFDLHEDDIYFCAADIGWVTGHSYIVYGPLANGATTVMFESTPTYPDAGRYWQVVDDLGVTIFYTAPTALRAIAREGDDWVHKFSRQSLRILGTVGEPINPEVWRWYHDVVGNGQLRHRRHLVADRDRRHPHLAAAGSDAVQAGLRDPAAVRCRAGAAGRRGQGARGQRRQRQPVHQAPVARSGAHPLRRPRALPRDLLLACIPGLYFTGDGCRRDEDGYYWITGRVDDVLNVSGHRLGTAEVESALVAHEAVAEAAVVGFPHDIKGVGIYAFVLITPEYESADPEELVAILRQQVRTVIGPIATPDKIQIARGLPKTRSGKIMRRILRKIAEGKVDEMGDVTTLADPSVVDDLLASLRVPVA